MDTTVGAGWARFLGVIIMLNRFYNTIRLALVALCIFAILGTALSIDWDSYTPIHAVGSEDDEWWTDYPDQHENAGSSVEHLDWVIDDLKDKPVLIFVHSSNCVPCLAQMPRIASAVEKYGDDLHYYDILAENSGYEKAIGILDVYDPDGGGQYVPTTVFITLAKGPDGNVDVAWNSQIDAMSQDEIDSYIEDSIYYYKANRDSWS
jgi:thiol-disulfide isomerase/thioredoxin